MLLTCDYHLGCVVVYEAKDVDEVCPVCKKIQELEADYKDLENHIQEVRELSDN